MTSKTSLFDDLFQIAARLPWWVSLVIGLGSGLYLHSVAGQPMAEPAADIAVGIFQYLLPLIFTFGAIASIVGRRKRRNLLGSAASAKAISQHDIEAKRPAPKPAAEALAQQIEPLIEKPAVLAAQPAQGNRARAPKVIAPEPPVGPDLPNPPACPHCRKTMVMRVARTGANAGGNFWGCADYPKCRGIRAIFAPMKL